MALWSVSKRDACIYSKFVMQKIKQFFYSEFIAGHSWFDYVFLLTGILLQVVVFFFSDDADTLTLVSSISGVLCVVLGAQGKISNFIFGFIQVTTYIYLSLVAKLYGQVGINVFYLLTMVFGVFTWLRQYRTKEDTEANQLQTRALSLSALVGTIVVVILACFALGYGFQQWSDDSQPYLDAFTTMPAIAAQLLMVARYRDQWYLWLAIDVFGTAMWIAQGNYVMAAMYAFWCANCVYGFINWTREAKPAESNS